jgi:AraC family transcriptional regulator
MDWLAKMNAVLDEIERNLTGEIDLNVLCMKAGCSSYNFQRMFSFITDIPLAEYIRRRRLTAAAFELKNGGCRVVDIAVKYGYDSATSFARAFGALHGVAPSEARRDGAKLKAYPRISFQISIKGEKQMDYRIETKEAFEVFGIETIASLAGEDGYLSPAGLWKKCQENGEYERLLENSGDLPPFVSQGLCSIHAVENYEKTPGNTFPYMLCAFVSAGSNTKGYKKIRIPSQTYAVFPSEPFKWDDISKTLSAMQKRFYTQWLPMANYERADGPNFEIYGGTAQTGYIELWYPVVKK